MTESETTKSEHDADLSFGEFCLKYYHGDIEKAIRARVAEKRDRQIRDMFMEDRDE